MTGHHRQVSGGITQASGDSDRSRGPEDRSPHRPDRHSTGHDRHWPWIFISSLKTHGGGAWALITMASLKFVNLFQYDSLLMSW
jgi:hypothetical protein